MYDASLDKIIPFNWYFSPRRTILLQAPRFSTGAGFQRSYQYDQTEAKYIKVPQYQYDRLIGSVYSMRLSYEDTVPATGLSPRVVSC